MSIIVGEKRPYEQEDATSGTIGEKKQRHAAAPGKWSEKVNNTVDVVFPISQVFFEGKSDFQSVVVAQTEPFGRALFIDNMIQSAEVDEHIYHESLVQPVMFAHPNPKRVFIGGGGEMGTAREVLRHSSVEQCIMVDIDEVVVGMCEKYLPTWGAGCWTDPRLVREYQDAKAYLDNYKGEPFDVIIMDICDPMDIGPGIDLYTVEFYQSLKRLLTPGGIVVTQAGCVDVTSLFDCHTVIYNTFKNAFDGVTSYSTNVASFTCSWGYVIGYFNSSETAAYANLHEKSPKQIDAILSSRGFVSCTSLKYPREVLTSLTCLSKIPKGMLADWIDDDAEQPTYATTPAVFSSAATKRLRHYTGNTHIRMFSPLPYYERALSLETRVMRKGNYVY